VAAIALLWAPALARAVFPGANGRLVVMAALYDPPNTTQLTWPWGSLSDIRFSADDTQVAGVVGLGDNGSAIWTADVDGANQAPLTSPPGSDQDMLPAWSPDGNEIAFVRESPGTCGGQPCSLYALMTVDVASGQTHTVIPPQAEDYYQSVDWSPDPNSTDVVIDTAPGSGGGAIELVDTSTGTTTTLASETSAAPYTSVRFAPDGNSVVTAQPNYQNAGHATVSVISTTGGQGLTFDVFAGEEGITYPTFTPDGQAVTMNACTSDGTSCGIWNAVLPAADAPPETQPTFQEVLAQSQSDYGPVAFLEWEPLLDAPIITAGPSGLVNSRDATFEFSIADEEAGKYQCQLDQGGWDDCSSPKSYSGLADGDHTFQVRFLPTDDPTPGPAAKRTWKIDTTPPEALMTSAPSGSTTATDATIYFTSTEPDGATYQCSVDGGEWYDCDSPQVLTGLDDGEHTFAVKATDAAGNEQQAPTDVSWQVVEPGGGGGGGGGSSSGLPPPTPPSDCSDGRYTKVAAGALVAVGRENSCFVRKPQADGSVDWIVSGPFSLNGVELTATAPITLKQEKSTISLVLPAGMTMGFGSFTWTLPHSVPIDLGEAASPAHFALQGLGKALKVAGLPVTANVDFQLSGDNGGSATVSLKLGLPPIFQGVDGEESSSGESSSVKPATVSFDFNFSTSNDNGPRFVGKFGVKDAWLFGGAVQVSNLSLGLDTGPPLSFDGVASMKFEGVKGTFSIEVGLSGEGAQPFPLVTKLAIEASDLNKPIAEGIFLQRFGGEFLSCPGGAELSANAGVSLGPEVDFAPVFKGSPVELDGAVTLHLCQPKSISVSGSGTVLGLPLGGAIVTYTWSTGKIDLQGDLGLKLGPFAAGAAITDSFFDMDKGTWQVEATGHVEVKAFGVAFSGDGDIVASSNGIAACFGPKDARYGVATHAINEPPTTFKAGTCDVGPYRANASARDAAAGQFSIRPHERLAVIAVHGQRALPEDSLHGPGGETINMPLGGAGLQSAQAVVLPDAASDTTYVVLTSPNAGTWTVVPEQGPAPASIQVADGLPAVQVAARVSGGGAGRRLRWSLKPLAGQKVTFVEQGAGVAHVLLRTDRARGSLRFTPAAGGARAREIEAFVTENGLPRDTVVLTHFHAPAPPKLRAIRVVHLRGRVLRWARQRGAAQYSLMLSTAGGGTASFLTGHASVRVPATMAGHTLTVWISAVGANGVPGPVHASTIRVHGRRRARLS